MENNNYKLKVESLLKENPLGLTIRDIALILDITRITVSIAIAELKGEGKLELREIGNSKLFTYKEVDNHGI